MQMDDTMNMVEGSDLDIINLESLLLFFATMSDFTINSDKSEVVVLGYALEDQQHWSRQSKL
jgi:hypothetical protein